MTTSNALSVMVPRKKLRVILGKDSDELKQRQVMMNNVNVLNKIKLLHRVYVYPLNRNYVVISILLPGSAPDEASEMGLFDNAAHPPHGAPQLFVC